MDSYRRDIGAYLMDAGHLPPLKHGLLVRLMDVYMVREGPIPNDRAADLVGARTRAERRATREVLEEFFERVDDAWQHAGCDAEIEWAYSHPEEVQAAPGGEAAIAEPGGSSRPRARSPGAIRASRCREKKKRLELERQAAADVTRHVESVTPGVTEGVTRNATSVTASVTRNTLSSFSHNGSNGKERESVTPETVTESVTRNGLVTGESVTRDADAADLAAEAALASVRAADTPRETDARRPMPLPARASSVSKPARPAPLLKTPLPADFGINDAVRQWAFAQGVTDADLRQHLECYRNKCRAGGYVYADHDAAFMEAIRADWAGLSHARAASVIRLGREPQEKFNPLGYVKQRNKGNGYERTVDIHAELVG
ncbi:YdaU family protein [Burkholderia pyrrocinia]|uniref:YdaU family protein n=1 Tax=Burkholderia pyrrocinia TaxID=60550 RepID=UPI001BCC1F77|nr:YdaU family protein [Burkholderia pyrrocinia]QVN18964.1 YdaU family protein [Burkholderia pyrrocinia]